MQQRDFLMRQIEQMSQAFAALIRRLLGLSMKDVEKETEKETNELLKDQLNTSIEELLQIPPKEISEFIVRKKGLDVLNLELFAHILMLNAKATSIHTDREKLYKIALEVYHWINNKSRTFSMERQSKIQEIEDYLTE